MEKMYRDEIVAMLEKLNEVEVKQIYIYLITLIKYKMK